MTDALDARWDELYRAARGDLYRAAVYLVGPSDAEELVQEAFMRAMQQKGFFATVREPSAWLRTVVVRAAISRLRAQRVRERLRLWAPDPQSGLPDPDLHRAIAALAPRQRAAVLLFYYFGASYAEIAQTLRMSDASIGQLLNRARDALRRALR